MESVGNAVGGKFELSKHLGAGSFGEVYLGVNSNNGDQVAIKLEKKDNRHQQLLLEAKLYRILAGSYGIPKVYTYGVDGEYNVLVIELLGLSLENCFTQAGRKMGLKSVLMLVDQTLARVEHLHSHNFLHRDIKPDNFLMGIGKNIGVVYMIDLGLAKKYKSTTTHQHIPYREGKQLTGTARYASIATHLGWEQSRRDDMVAIGYMMMYFIRGSLPWQGLHMMADKGDKGDKYKKIMESKMSTSVEELCDGYPDEFAKYFKYLSTLEFQERPNYDFCRKLFKDCMKRHNFDYDYVYDWTPAQKEPKHSSSNKATLKSKESSRNLSGKRNQKNRYNRERPSSQ
eukprot:GEMP01020983.1.p1 GENE.GEMP01020983.1~~GEMP01020983.1.p1  ORF type:complete len:355 (+),score=39.95 GEMP01020983.1:42-1067(+)